MSSRALVSWVANATSTETRHCAVSEVLNAIRTGARQREVIEAIRKRFKSELAQHGDYKKTKLAIDPLKKALRGILWSGQCSRRDNASLLKHSGLLCADLDDLGPELPRVRERLRKSPHLFALFLSPTGNGLKAVFRVPADGAKHARSFRAVQKHVRDLTGVQIDQKCKDPARLCFMSYDPQLYVNGNATEIKPLPEPVKEKPVKAGDGLPPDLSLREAIATRELGPLKYSAEKGGYFCKCPGEATHTSRSGEKHTIVYLNSVPTLDCQHKSCKKIVEAFNVKLRSEIGKAERQANPGAAKVEVRSGETAGDGLLPTSLTSPGADVFPAPLEPAAFHGLAGRFVERIFPHTEADRAALLFSFLVAFGNVIGRTAHAIADGARHFCNLNVVLVGPTSKGRKGSARWHTNRLLGCVDEEWIENCIASGLSSGEGLIAAVQDAVTKQVKNKKSGKEETKIIEPGKTDKRLLVIQTEFSTALKAMEREGNTLSSVIRSAWDCEPKLRTLTKNSPTCATDPHISIVGHITAEELRPGLSEIEAANGFGNRFLWVPVKRSKELPEGGELPPIADLIEPLQNAVAGAKKRKEPLKRDEAAREFWAKIYHDLSAEQPGLFGAITARSEAQCLRLSDLYALLDCAPFVGVEHLEAALAAWRYCEKGARWIFRTGTGNRDADRILAALGAAGQKGLTRLQITNEVFSRHATKFEIDEALRLLHSLKLAVRKMEGTATRPAERWFCKAQQREVCEESNPGDGEMGDTSHSSHRPPSKNASLAESDKEAETLVGDESGVARL